ncbi:MFS transporter [Paenibacillus naphthalenovorans]|uniref:MFS transporter n=1 Tax=Paenibacillus naphthalenovorans TaxID=162209 RepID=UPI003D2C4B16
MPTLFQNRVFRIVALADLMQQLAIWVRNIALLFYVMEQTNNDPVAVSLLTVFEYAPIFLFSFIGGAFADRWNPKRTIIAGDLLSALSVAAILLFVLAGSWQAVFAATIVSAIVSQFSQPSSAIMFKRHVPEELVGAAIGITQSLMSLFIIVGPIIGTLLYSLLGITNSLVILICLFLAAAALQLALPPSPRNPERRTVPILEDIKEGIRYVRGSRNLVVIALMFACIGLGSGIIQPLDIYIVTERLGLDKENIQWFYALSGAGMLIGGAAAAVGGTKLNPRGVAFTGIAFLSLSIVIEALSVWVPLTAAMRFLVGVMMAFMQTVLGALMIKMVEEAYIGRVNGAITPLLMAGIVAGSTMAGFLMKTFTLVPVYCLSAGIILIAAFVSLGLRFETAANSAEHPPA